MEDIKKIRRFAIHNSLFAPTTLEEALQRMQFVQADPIRSPARAQDLILRHRVQGYKAGDLEKHYPTLDLEEDFLYAHGFIKRNLWKALHPRKKYRLTAYENKILLAVQEQGSVHPRQLTQQFGKRRVIGAWGTYSHATKIALDNLHYYGYLRVSGREKGIRLYERMEPVEQQLSLQDRMETLITAVVRLLNPVVERTLNQSLFRVRADLGETKPIIQNMVEKGLLQRVIINKMTFITLPHTTPSRMTAPGNPHLTSQNNPETEVPELVRFLAPFDPLIWDRDRFEQFWGWQYRFEAYTPPAKRIRGFYAIPILWRDDIIGWVNAKVDKGTLHTKLGYIKTAPRDNTYKRELEAEIERLRAFLNISR